MPSAAPAARALLLLMLLLLVLVLVLVLLLLLLLLLLLQQSPEQLLLQRIECLQLVLLWILRQWLWICRLLLQLLLLLLLRLLLLVLLLRLSSLHKVTAPDGVTGSSDVAGRYHVHQTGALFAVRGRAGTFFITGGMHRCNHHHRSRCCHCHRRQCRRRCCRQRGCRGRCGWQRCGCCGQRGGGDAALERRSRGRGQRTRRGEALAQGARGPRGKPCRCRSRHLAHGACARRGRRKRRGRLRRRRWRRKRCGRQRRRCGCGHRWRRCRGRGRLGCPSELRGRCGLSLACRR
mmetsp:Transcript_130729/g.419312  ORF Transcript_130729/g.419312 Transcript_130729/m.419312 type:complete len:291 (-) Transcript_130729:432-1304(-)